MRLRQKRELGEPLGRRDRFLVDLDFERARMRVGKAAGARLLGLPAFVNTGGAGFKFSRTAAGLYLPVPANDPGETDAGLGAWSARTNKCTNFSGVPSGTLFGVSGPGVTGATLTEVDDTAALEAAGFGPLIAGGKMNGKAFKLDNTAGAGDAVASIAGATGNTNPHAVVAWVRGVGQAWVGYTNFPDNVAENGAVSALTAGYQRRAATLTPVNSTRNCRVGVKPGGVVYFILNELKEGSDINDPPVIVGGVAATRTADAPVLRLSRPLKLPFWMAVEWSTDVVNASVTRRVLNVRSEDGARRSAITLTAGSATARISTETGSTAAANAFALGSRARAIAVFDRDAARMSLNGGAVATWAGGSADDLTHVELGHLLASNHLDGTLLRARIGEGLLTVAQLQGALAP